MPPAKVTKTNRQVEVIVCVSKRSRRSPQADTISTLVLPSCTKYVKSSLSSWLISVIVSGGAPPATHRASSNQWVAHDTRQALRMAVPSVDVAAVLAVDARARGRPSIGSADQRPHQGVELREQWLQVCRVVDAPRLHRTGAAVVWQSSASTQPYCFYNATFNRHLPRDSEPGRLGNPTVPAFPPPAHQALAQPLG